MERVDATVTSRWTTVAELLREFAVGGLAGVVSGFLVAGVAGRLAMRLIALVAPDDRIGLMTEGGNVVGEVTFGGTIAFLAFVGLGFGAFGATMLVAMWPWLSRWPPHHRPLALGLFALAVGGVDVIEPDNIDFPISGNEMISVLLLASLFILWGYAAIWFRSVFEKRFASDSRQWTIVYAVIVVIGIPLYLGFLTILFDDVDTNTPTVVAISVAVIYLSAIGLWALKVWANGAAITKTIRTIGYAAIAVVLIVGLTKVVTDAITIIA
jgi:hypothetical protein